MGQGLPVRKEWPPLDPEVLEYKYYALNVGLVLVTEEDGTPMEALVPKPASLAMLSFAAPWLLRRRNRGRRNRRHQPGTC